LIQWLIANIAVGFTAVTISRNSQIVYLLVTAIFLFSIIIIKLIFSTLHICKSRKDKWFLKRFIKTKEGKKFNPEQFDPDKEDFDIYKYENTSQLSESMGDASNHELINNVGTEVNHNKGDSKVMDSETGKFSAILLFFYCF